MKLAIITAALAVCALPAAAQEATPLLRVYIDAPYFYEILATTTDASDSNAQQIELRVEGKEVGSSEIVYSCETGAFSQIVVDEWTGGADAYIPAALMAYARLAC